MHAWTVTVSAFRRRMKTSVLCKYSGNHPLWSASNESSGSGGSMLASHSRRHMSCGCEPASNAPFCGCSLESSCEQTQCRDRQAKVVVLRASSSHGLQVDAHAQYTLDDDQVWGSLWQVNCLGDNVLGDAPLRSFVKALQELPRLRSPHAQVEQIAVRPAAAITTLRWQVHTLTGEAGMCEHRGAAAAPLQSLNDCLNPGCR